MAHDHRMNSVGEPHLNRVQRLSQQEGPQPPLGYISFSGPSRGHGGWKGLSALPRVRKALAASPSYAERLQGATSDAEIADNLERYRVYRDLYGGGTRNPSRRTEESFYRLNESIKEGRGK